MNEKKKQERESEPDDASAGSGEIGGTSREATEVRGVIQKKSAKKAQDTESVLDVENSQGDESDLDTESGRGDEYGHRYLSSEAINAWRITRALGSLVYWIVPLGYGAMVAGSPEWPEWPAYVLGLLFLTYTILEGTVIPYVRWKRWRYRVDRNEIDLQRGIFVVTRTLIPVKRVQHVDTRQGPVYRQFGLASVTVTTAGDTHEIPALSESVADDLRNKISEYARIAREDL